ncbi:MAG: hypothetical protein V3R67_03480 [Thermodesulfobacteriota bacterium]
MDFDTIVSGLELINGGHLKKCIELMKNSNDKETLEKCVSILDKCSGKLEDALYCLREYIEPWQCPDCSSLFKIPENPDDKRQCPNCKNNNCFPYVYIQQEIANNRLKILLPCAVFYEKQPNGGIAKEAIMALGNVNKVPEKA